MTTAAAPARTTITRAQRTSIIAACIGNFIEWYEFVLYGYLASTIAVLYFPVADPAAGLLLTFAVFGVSFVVRPLGGVVFGYIGDRYGRRSALSAIILLISLGTALMAVVPPYASIGVAAPILILVLRLAQGLSAGGEWTGAVSYIIESAPPGKRAYYGSWQTITIVLGMMVAGLSSLLCTELLSPADLQSWGWRIPFLAALPLGLVGLYLRLRLGETPAYTELAAEDKHERAPLRATLRHDWRSMVRIAALVCSPTMCTYVLLVYGPTYLATVLHVPPGRAKIAGFAAMTILIVLTVVFARMCDRIGRKPFLIAGAAWVLVTAPLGFFLLHRASLGFLIAGLGVMVVGEALMLGPQPALFAELFPTARRYSGVGIGYNAGVVLFGGAGPLVATAILEATGSTYAPAWYLAGGALISLVAAFLTPETRHNSLQGGTP
ncbi:MFS transporter [Amycolatopsis sp. AA4]|uniref:MFS transporter n=1 Tax=Actinomycetes TaxID=1760 RepID=UPI0001B55087|nr:MULTISPECIES: MFS transporter [Actinomycetes]ATY12602.1 MFS transporter [Amycolatopsis sp. AA4]EFL08398.1 proline/betaine transporter [Streptomyces sp. AA4]